jgi:superfamily I DNA/RNA helicase
MGGSSRKRFLERIRRIEALNEDTVYRAISSEASEIDAIRVMTIHGSKGLEFRAVHLPAIGTGYMPASWRGIRIVPPPTLERIAIRPDGHEAEEECLFFVGMSRARA